MITMPGGMNFCHDCMQKAFDSVTQSGLDFSKLQNMPYMNMNLSDFPNLENMNLEIPKKNKVKKKKEKEEEKKQQEFSIRDIPAPHVIKSRDVYKRQRLQRRRKRKKQRRTAPVTPGNRWKMSMAVWEQVNPSLRNIRVNLCSRRRIPREI